MYTQDTLKERDWIKNQFLNYTHLETVNSGLWDTKFPTNSKLGNLYEIAYSDNFTYDQLINCDLPSVKSVYDKSLGLIDKNWTYADRLLTNMSFSSNPLASLEYQIITFSRSGTVFLESLLNEKCSELRPHMPVGSLSSNQKAKELFDRHPNINIIIIYRKDWWNWLTSQFIGEQVGFYHHASNINWQTISPMVIPHDYIQTKQESIINTWNFLCNLRVQLPNYSFYLLEFSDIISKYQGYSTHTKIAYDKHKLISNFFEVERIFNTQYKSQWEKIEKRCCSHLYEMGCLNNLDQLLK